MLNYQDWSHLNPEFSQYNLHTLYAEMPQKELKLWSKSFFYFNIEKNQIVIVNTTSAFSAASTFHLIIAE